MNDYVEPAHHETAFNCPACGAFAEQNWVHDFSGLFRVAPQPVGYQPPGLSVAVCRRCGAYSVWCSGTLVHPTTKLGPLAHADMPEDRGIKEDYEEARSIAAVSPRGAAALVRLVIQKLCRHLGENGLSLNDDIASLVRKGLPSDIQKALDVLRVVGNESVHPGQMDLRDDTATAVKLFALVNLIVQDRITAPRQIAEMFDSLPEDKRRQIEERDAPPAAS